MGSVRLVKASAGSGKTYRLAYEYVRSVVDEPSLYRNILAVTFTNKATEEMKRRIVAELNALASGQPTGYLADLERDLGLTKGQIVARSKVARTRILHDYSHFSILTIDKFFQRIIRSFIKELGIDMNFNLELKTDTLLSSAADALIDDISTNERLKAWIVDFVEEKIEQSRKWEVKKDLADLGKEIFKEEFKTRGSQAKAKEEIGTLVADLIKRSQGQKKYLSSIGHKALELMAKNGLQVDDFIYNYSGVAGYFSKISAGVVVPYKKRVEEALQRDEAWYAKTSPRKGDIIALLPRLRPLLEEICSGVDSHLRLETSVGLMRENFRNFALLEDLSQKVRLMCEQQSIMPISETNSILSRLIAGNDTPFIFEKVGNNFSQFMIDEFQDTSALQWENFLPLLHNALAQSEQSPVLIVGDVKQSIYRWRGGDWQILENRVAAAFQSVEQTQLEKNYRSDRNIVEFNNNLIGECVRQDNTALDGLLGEAADSGAIPRQMQSELTGLMVRAYSDHTQISNREQQSGYINITLYATDTEEEDETQGGLPPIIRRVEQLQRRGYGPSDIAFLVRSNKEGSRVANMLLEHKSSHPESPYCYDVVTQEALTIGFSPAVRFVTACLELGISGENRIKLAIYNRWFDRGFNEPLPQTESAFIATLSTKSPEEAFESVVQHFDLGARDSDIAYLQALHEQILTFTNSSIADIPLFLKWWNDSGAKESINIPATGRAMTVITVHKAKGLDFKAVIIPYCNWNMDRKTTSIFWAKAEQELDEVGDVPLRYKRDVADSYFAPDYYREFVMSHIDSLNILYVALTRARNELHIMIPLKRGELLADGVKRKGRIGGLILGSIATQGAENHTLEARIGTMVGRSRGCEKYRVYQFGTTTPNTSHSETGESVSVGFESYNSGGKVRLSFASARYFDQGGSSPDISPRDYGVLMHKAFEQAVTTADILNNVRHMELDGVVSKAESSRLFESISKELSKPTIASWFDGTWTEVRNENDIIIPANSHNDALSTRRPDRVMVRGRRAVVVDYKFGLLHNAKYPKQVRHYMDLLNEMGFDEVEGYIWYVSLGELEKI